MKAKYLLSLVAVAAAMAGCKYTADIAGPPPGFGKEPYIDTYSAVAVYADSATLRGTYNPPQGWAPQEKGFLVSLETIPDGADVASFVGNNGDSLLIKVATPARGDFQAPVYDLKVGYIYHFRAYLKVPKGGGYNYFLGQEFTFHADNLNIDLPAAPTGNITTVGSISCNVNMVIGSIGGDNLSGLDKAMLKIYRAGIYCWRTADQTLADTVTVNLSYPRPTLSTAVCNLMGKGTSLNVIISGLQQDTQYSWCFFVQTGINRSYMPNQPTYLDEVRSDVQTFTTTNNPYNPSGPPDITVTPLDYAYRVANFTTTSAHITLTVSGATVDPTIETNPYGVDYGTDPANLGSVAPGANFDPGTGTFTVDITGLAQNTTYYLSPFATNSVGQSTPLSTPVPFRPAVDGGLQWLFNSSSAGYGGGWSFTKMYQGTTQLVYFELDPIVGTDGATYYLLDRDLGAVKPFDNTNYNVSPSTNASNYDAIGYYYQWNLNVPSFSPFPSSSVTATTRAANQTAWLNAYATSASGAIPEAAFIVNGQNDGTSWPNTGWSTDSYYNAIQGNPCPPGYVIPSSAQWGYLLSNWTATDKTWLNLFNKMKIGMTASRLTSGAITTTPTYLWLWTSTCKAGQSADALYFDGTNLLWDGTGTSGQTNAGKLIGAAVRCARVQ